MEVSIAGCIIALIIAMISVFGRKVAIIAAISAFAFPSTAIVTLTALGSASITVPQFGLGCLALNALTSGDIGHKLSNIFKTEPSAQILSLIVLFAISGSFIMPRLFQDVTEVFSLARTAGGKGNILTTVPLTPTSGNITQPFYFLGNVAGFYSVLILCQSQRGIDSFYKGMISLIIVHSVGGGIDFASKYAVGFDLLEFSRTAKYAMLVDVDVLNFKRIVGLYPEASAFAYASIAYTGFMFGAWRIVGSPGAVWLFFSVLTCLLVSTSSTAYFCVAVLAMFYGIALVRQIITGKIEELAVILFLVTLILAIITLTILIVYPRTLQPFTDLIEKMVFNKADSESARQRFGWNSQAVVNFIQTGGVGAGLGSLRSSSWPLTLFAEQGLIGALLYFTFLASIFTAKGAPKSASDRRLSGFSSSCKVLMAATLVAAVASSALFDLGAAFYISAACAVATNRVDRGDTFYQRWYQLRTSKLDPAVQPS